MGTHPPLSPRAEEICGALEHAVLKYFPFPDENIDAFLFASVADNPANGNSSGRDSTSKDKSQTPDDLTIAF